MNTVVTKVEFLAAASHGDLDIVQHYLAEPMILSSVATLERVLCGDQCDDIRSASRTLMAVSRGLWFSVDGDWGGIFRRALVNQQTEVLDWLFSAEFASTCPITLQVVFPHIASRAIDRNDALAMETLLNSWVFLVAMTSTTRARVLCELYWRAQSTGHILGLLLAHGADANPGWIE